MTEPLRIGNASGFYGDRFDAPAELLAGGELDVLTGDYLAELTMLILARDRLKDPSLGYAKTFLKQLETTLGTALDRGVRIVSNAGGLNPAGLAAGIAELADRLGLQPRIGYVTGDDVRAQVAQHGLGKPLAANAYLGGWGIADCLAAGADVVVTGRVTDASLVLGPAAAHFGWTRLDFDQLAGAVVAGHVLECGTQATGGNYSFFTELADPLRPGFPIAEVAADGSCVITKHSGTGGEVSVGTVTAQLLYEIGGPRYAGPDVTTRFDTVQLRHAGPDRVAISGLTGEPPPPSYKVCLSSIGGFRNEVAFVLTGLDIEAKAELVRRQLAESVGLADLEWTLARTDRPDADTEETASATLRCVVRAAEPDRIARRFSDAAVQLALGSYPGCHLAAPPGEAKPYGVMADGYLPVAVVEQLAVLPDGSSQPVPPVGSYRELAELAEPTLPEYQPSGPTRWLPLGTVLGARSGDKAGSANLGIWVREPRMFDWLAATLSVAALRTLLPELSELPIRRYLLPNLSAVNFVIDGLLGRGVGYQARFDPQAKGLAEWLRSRYFEIPEEFLA
jgi:hypothetical protein